MVHDFPEGKEVVVRMRERAGMFVRGGSVRGNYFAL